MSPRFQWDYPSQGMRSARTMNEAFGPYAVLDTGRKPFSKSLGLYAVAATLVLATIIIANIN